MYADKMENLKFKCLGAIERASGYMASNPDLRNGEMIAYALLAVAEAINRLSDNLTLDSSEKEKK